MVGETPIWTSTSPYIDIDLRVRTISQWVHDCDMNHRDCVIDLSHCVLPTRLLDVMTDNPRLITLNKAINELKVLPTRPTYLALSHCWGKDGVPLKTTKETVGKFEQSIPFEDLPRTLSLNQRLQLHVSTCQIIPTMYAEV
jgi:hypothetical protein